MTRPQTTADGLPFALTAVDRELLSQTDDEFKPHSWRELEGIIGEEALVVPKRPLLTPGTRDKRPLGPQTKAV